MENTLYADLAIPEIPPQKDPRKNDDWTRRMEQLIADAEDIAELARSPDSDPQQISPMVAKMTKKCSRCHELYGLK